MSKSEQPAGVEVISGDMDVTLQSQLAELCIDSLRTTSVVKDVPKAIKLRIERTYGQLWHVVIVQGQFWSHFGHEPGHSLVFRFEKRIFIVWKTPMV